MNNFVLYEESYRAVDVTQEFENGRKYLVPMMDRNQKVRWMEWSFSKFSENLNVLVGQDVSEKIELENTYELLVQNVEDMIYTVDINGYFSFLNNPFMEKMGYTKEELVDKQSLYVVPDEYRSEVEEFYVNHFKENRATSYREIPIKKKSGEIIWIGQHVNTIYAPGSKSYINGFIALARDITEKRRQQQVIRDQRDDITSSISYAQKIQLNLLPHKREFQASFEDHFVLFKPKDIVSGDFYWMNKIGSKHVVILADCTGHGVPGAFMTLLGINLLNSIVLEARLTDPGMILNELDKRLHDYLHKDEEDRVNDGMEVTVCVIDDQSEEFAYACAGSRFLIFKDELFTMFKGDNSHIGDEKSESFKGYNTQYAPFREDEVLYLFTDGFQDQFGGPKNKKFSFRRLLELLEENANLSLDEQQKMINVGFEKWQGSEPQTDDVSLIAIKRKPN